MIEDEEQVRALAIETTTITYTVAGVTGNFPISRPTLPNQTLTVRASVVPGETAWQWTRYSDSACTTQTTTSALQSPGLGAGAANAVNSLRVLTFNGAEQIGDSGCQVVTIRFGTVKIVYTDLPQYTADNTADPFSVRLERSSNEVGPPPAGVINLYLCPISTTPNPASCTAATGAAGAATVTAPTTGAAVGGNLTYATRSHVFTRLAADSTNRHTVPASIVTSEGVATASSVLRYTPTGGQGVQNVSGTTLPATLPNHTLTFSLASTTGATRVEYRFYDGLNCAGPSRITNTTGLTAALTNGAPVGTYTVRATSFNASNAIVAASPCVTLNVTLGIASVNISNSLAFNFAGYSDSFTLSVPRSGTTPTGPLPIGRVDVYLCPTSQYTAAQCRSAPLTALALAGGVNVNPTNQTAPSVTGSAVMNEPSHARYIFTDSAGRYGGVTTTTSDGLTAATATITYSVDGSAGNAAGTPFLPNQVVTFATSYTGQRYSWSIYGQPGCVGTPLQASAQTNIATIGYTFTTTGSYSARIVISQANGTRVAESGCTALTSQHGIASIAISNGLTYAGDGASDTFSLTVPRSGTTPVGPQPTGRVDITLCPTSDYTAAQCETATGLPVAATFGLVAGATVTGSVVFPQMSQVRYSFVPDANERYDGVLVVTSNDVFIRTTPIYILPGIGTYPMSKAALPNQEASFTVQSVPVGATVETHQYFEGLGCAGQPFASTPQINLGDRNVLSLRITHYDGSGVLVGDTGCKVLTIRKGTAQIIFEDPITYRGGNISDPFRVRLVRTSDEAGPQPTGSLFFVLCPMATTTAAQCQNANGAAVGRVGVASGTSSTGSLSMPERSHVLTRYQDDPNRRYLVPSQIVTSEAIDRSVTLEIGSGSVQLGALRPDCVGAPAGATCTATAEGAVYTYASAISISVTASDAWSGGCGRQPQTAASSTPDRLMIRPSGTTGWQMLPIVDGTAQISPGCFGSYPPGTNLTFTFDLAVTVRWTDPPADLRDVVVFEVTTT